MKSFSYIQKINITGLWHSVNMAWTLNRDVNILAGRNGSGKSTVIRSLVELLNGGRLSADSLSMLGDISVTFENGEVLSSSSTDRRTVHNVNAISTFDNRLSEPDGSNVLSDGLVRTELDRDIYRIQKRYMSYQLEHSRRIIALLKKKAPEAEIEAITEHKERFFNIIDSLFAPTGKSIDRGNDEFSFTSSRGTISPYALSAGEKQMLIILATVLIQDNNPYILIMDEPDMSLHFDWQKRLLENIMSLNPNVQVIMSTHSPAVIMDGWMGHVTEIGDLMV